MKLYHASSWRYLEDFINEKISKNAFVELAKFQHLTHQISFFRL